VSIFLFAPAPRKSYGLMWYFAEPFSLVLDAHSFNRDWKLNTWHAMIVYPERIAILLILLHLLDLTRYHFMNKATFTLLHLVFCFDFLFTL